MQKTATRKTQKKTAPRNPVYTKIREDSRQDARKYVEGWRVPKGAE